MCSGTVTQALRSWRQEGQEFKTSLGYTGILRSVWDTPNYFQMKSKKPASKKMLVRARPAALSSVLKTTTTKKTRSLNRFSWPEESSGKNVCTDKQIPPVSFAPHPSPCLLIYTLSLLCSFFTLSKLWAFHSIDLCTLSLIKTTVKNWSKR